MKKMKFYHSPINKKQHESNLDCYRRFVTVMLCDWNLSDYFDEESIKDMEVAGYFKKVDELRKEMRGYGKVGYRA